MPTTSRDKAPSQMTKRHLYIDTSNVRTNFYREELLKHWQCLEQQREYYSEKAMSDVEAALRRLMLRVDRLCAEEHGDQIVSQLLRKIDSVTRLSAWSRQKPTH